MDAFKLAAWKVKLDRFVAVVEQKEGEAKVAVEAKIAELKTLIEKYEGKL